MTRKTNGYRAQVGVIGCGLWGTAHLQAYLRLPHVEVVAVCDASEERARSAANQYGISQWFGRYEDLCALPGLDAVSIVTPEAEHLGPVLAAAQRGLHILVEKPVASEVSEVEKMIEAARAADVILMPGHILRFEPRYAFVKDKLENGGLGAIATIQARRNRTKETRRKYARAHPVFAAAIHDIDIVLWYVESPVKRVRGYHRNIAGNTTPDVFWGILEFENGVLSSIECTWLTPDAAGIPSDDILHVITDRGVASIDFVHTGLMLWKDVGFEVPDVSVAPLLQGTLGGALADELSYFASCALTGKQPEVVTSADAVACVRIAAALLESAEKDQEIKFA